MLTQKEIYKVIEREDTDVPLDKVYKNGHLEIYEEVQNKGYFTITLKREGITLTAGNQVGLIPLNSSVILHVEPKIAKSNWFYIVSKAQGNLSQIPIVSDYVRKGSAEKPLTEFLVKTFLTQLGEVEQKGLYQNYLSKLEVTSFPKGRILFGESIKRSWSQGLKNSVAVKFYELSRDVAHNRLLKYALHLSIEHLNSFSNFDSEGLRISDLLNIFRTVPLDPSLKYIPEVANTIKSKSIPEFRYYYENVCNTAILLVANSGIHPEISGSYSTHSFVVNMETAFEDYCLNVLKSYLQTYNWLSVNKGKKEKHFLFKRGNSDRRRAEPDAVIWGQNNEILVIEIKYKSDPNRQDINQAVTYAVSFNTTKTVILCFADSEKLSGWQYLGCVGGKVETWIYRIFLDSANIKIEEDKLAFEFDDMLNHCFY